MPGRIVRYGRQAPLGDLPRGQCSLAAICDSPEPEDIDPAERTVVHAVRYGGSARQRRERSDGYVLEPA